MREITPAAEISAAVFQRAFDACLALMLSIGMLLVASFLAALVATQLAHAGEPSPSAASGASANPCDGIRIGFHEHIAPQGFFGALTPRADAAVVREALARAQSDAREKLSGYEEYEFDWRAVCELAKSKGHKVLWIGCSSDTEEDDPHYYGSQANKNVRPHLVNAECVISTYHKDNKPDFDDLMEYPLIHGGGDRLTLYNPGDGEDDRYDAVKKREVRRDLYVRALKNSVGLLHGRITEERFRREQEEERQRYLYGPHSSRDQAGCDQRQAEAAPLAPPEQWGLGKRTGQAQRLGQQTL